MRLAFVSWVIAMTLEMAAARRAKVVVNFMVFAASRTRNEWKECAGAGKQQTLKRQVFAKEKPQKRASFYHLWCWEAKLLTDRSNEKPFTGSRNASLIDTREEIRLIHPVLGRSGLCGHRPRSILAAGEYFTSQKMKQRSTGRAQRPTRGLKIWLLEGISHLMSMSGPVHFRYLKRGIKPELGVLIFIGRPNGTQ